MSITSKGKKACVILDNNQVVTKILVLQEVWELEGDMLLKFAVDVKKGDTLVRISGTNVVADADYKIGDYLYFAKGTFQPSQIRFTYFNDNNKEQTLNLYSEVRFLKGFDCSKLTLMYDMFCAESASSNTLMRVVDLSHLDTSKVYNMQWALGGMPYVTKLDVSNFNTSNVTEGYSIFRNNSRLVDFDVSGWDTHNFKGMNFMFAGIAKKTLDLTNFVTSNVTNMQGMFSSCRSLTSLDVSNFDTSKVTDMNSMFSYCYTLTSLDVSGWNTSKVTTMSYMFYGCQSLTSLDVSNFDTSKVTDMRSMFSYCYTLTNLIFGSKWGTQTSTEANALTLDLSTIGSSKSYKLTDETYNSMLTMYDRASNGLTTMTIKFSKSHNLPDGFAEKMSALGYTITLV